MQRLILSAPFSSLLSVLLIMLVIWSSQHGHCSAATGAKQPRYLLKKPNCSEKHLEQIEIKIARMLPMGKYARKLPESKEEAKFFCRESKKLVGETEQFFKTCYKKEMLDLAKIIIFTVKQNIKLYCRKNTKRLEKILEVAPCANKHIHQIELCVDGFMNETKQLINFKNNDKRKIQYACCNYVETMRCVENKIDEIVCSQNNNKELIMDTIRGVTGNFVNFACGDFDETSSKCDRLGKQPKLTEPVTKYYYTPIFLLVDLMESMESFQSV